MKSGKKLLSMLLCMVVLFGMVAAGEISAAAAQTYSATDQFDFSKVSKAGNELTIEIESVKIDGDKFYLHPIDNESSSYHFSVYHCDIKDFDEYIFYNNEDNAFKKTVQALKSGKHIFTFTISKPFKGSQKGQWLSFSNDMEYSLNYLYPTVDYKTGGETYGLGEIEGCHGTLKECTNMKFQFSGNKLTVKITLPKLYRGERYEYTDEDGMLDYRYDHEIIFDDSKISVEMGAASLMPGVGDDDFIQQSPIENFWNSIVGFFNKIIAFFKSIFSFIK